MSKYTHHECRCARAEELAIMADEAEKQRKLFKASWLASAAVSVHAHEVEVRVPKNCDPLHGIEDAITIALAIAGKLQHAAPIRVTGIPSAPQACDPAGALFF